MKYWFKFAVFFSVGLVAGVSGAWAAPVAVPEILPRSTWETPALAKLATWNPQRGGTSAAAVTGSDKAESGAGANPSGVVQKIYDYAPIERVIIHDTGCVAGRPGCNNSDLEAVTVIQNIFRFHAITRGWGDLGYHYLIDYDGKIYEGRRGGNGVRGAHLYDDRLCQNFNLGTVGVALLGNYQKQAVPEAMVESLAELVAWLSYTNGFDVTATQAATPVWSNERAVAEDGRPFCNLGQGGYNSTFLGPTVLTHHDVEAGNSDVANLNLPDLRQRAAALMLGYQKLGFESSDLSGTYIVGQGQLRKIAEPGEALTGARWLATVPLAATQLALFPLVNPPQFANDTLVTVSDLKDLPMFLIEGAERRPILAPELIEQYHLTDAPRASARALELNSYPMGTPLIFLGPVILKNTADESLYLIESGRRRHITAGIIYDELKFPGVAVIEVSSELIAAHPVGGEPLTLPDQALIKNINAAEVYMLSQGRRLLIGDPKLFDLRGYKWADVINLTSAEVMSYPFGGYVAWPDGTVLKPKDKPEVYIVAKGRLRWIKTPQVYKGLGIKDADVTKVSLAEVRFYEQAEPITKVTRDVRALLQRRTVVAFAPGLNLLNLLAQIRDQFGSLLAQVSASLPDFLINPDSAASE